MRRRWTRAALPLVGLALTATVIARAGQPPELGRWLGQAPATAPVPPPMPASILAEGRVVADPGAEVLVGTEISGRITRLEVREKDRVAAGQLLVEINSDETRAAIEEALARVREAEADIRFYEREIEREFTLLRRQAGTQQTLDAHRRALEQAQARRALARAAADRHRAQLDKAAIRAPIAGTVVARHADPGETVEASAPLLTIVDLDRVRIEAEVDEYDTFRIAAGARVDVSAEGSEDTWGARVEEVPDAVVPRRIRPEDPGRPIDARVLLVKARLDRPAPLKLGQRVEVRILETHPGSGFAGVTGTDGPSTAGADSRNAH
jgi:RND family efflux transporter MFP subunit